MEFIQSSSPGPQNRGLYPLLIRDKKSYRESIRVGAGSNEARFEDPTGRGISTKGAEKLEPAVNHARKKFCDLNRVAKF
jgi:hypothetical protein